MRRAWAPSPMAATTSKPASLRSRLTESRHIGWSSTTMTRVAGPLTVPSLTVPSLTVPSLTVPSPPSLPPWPPRAISTATP